MPARLSSTHCLILRTLLRLDEEYGERGSYTGQEVERRANLNPSVVSLVALRLEELGLLETQPPIDGHLRYRIDHKMVRQALGLEPLAPTTLPPIPRERLSALAESSLEM
jgi:DNA-binding IclR family transcriptional regulator